MPLASFFNCSGWFVSGVIGNPNFDRNFMGFDEVILIKTRSWGREFDDPKLDLFVCSVPFWLNLGPK